MMREAQARDTLWVMPSQSVCEGVFSMFTDRLKKNYWTAGMPHLIFGGETELEMGWYPSGDCYIPVSAFVGTGKGSEREEVSGRSPWRAQGFYHSGGNANNIPATKTKETPSPPTTTFPKNSVRSFSRTIVLMVLSYSVSFLISCWGLHDSSCWAYWADPQLS